ncbi:unnamed protein product [Schistosoma curassoni]|uniref:CCHC-type domain-containing protein n=1 Tax=Schistosoma curassoni TaxID=6186 RepID=A0A183JPK3_9TREM|nr:unnamed protein product [Schistosoma curassoni]
MNKKHGENVNAVAHFFRFIGKEAYSSLKTLDLPDKRISLSFTTVEDLLLDYVKYTNFECGRGGRFCKMIHEDIKKSTTLLRYPNPVHTQGYADNNSLRSCDRVHEDRHKFGQCLSCDRFHSFSSCKFRNCKCFKCGDIGHIQSVCTTTVHLAATNIKSYMVSPNDSDISDEIPSKSEESMLNEPSHDRKPDVVLMDADFPNDPFTLQSHS